MEKYFNRRVKEVNNKRRGRTKSSLLGKIIMPLACTVIGGGITYILKGNSEANQREVLDAFAGDCRKTIISVANYGEYAADAPAVAREQFEILRNKYPERFKKITNQEGIDKILESYNKKRNEFEVPVYDCK